MGAKLGFPFVVVVGITSVLQPGGCILFFSLLSLGIIQLPAFFFFWVWVWERGAAGGPGEGSDVMWSDAHASSSFCERPFVLFFFLVPEE